MTLKSELATLNPDIVTAAVNGFLAKQLTYDKVRLVAGGEPSGPYSGLNEAISQLMSHVVEADPFDGQYSEPIIEAIGMGVCLLAGVITEAAEIQDSQIDKAVT